MATKLFILILASFAVAVTSMAIEAPIPQTINNPITTSTWTNPHPIRRTTPSFHRRFQIRRTRISDLDAISTMLAMESVPSRDTNNWNDGMKRLRAKSSLHKQLTHRLAAVDEGRETAQRFKVELCTIAEFEDHAHHLLWSNGNFRNKLKAAVTNSQETNAWTAHNFDDTPTSDMLNHAMMSVEESCSGQVVGFCEVAWLPSPISKTSSMAEDDRIRVVSNESLNIQQNELCEETSDSYCDMAAHSYRCVPNSHCAPAIVNLVTSPSHRRMGIASRILAFASKFTTSKWKCCYKNSMSSLHLGLFVHPENYNAIRLYNKKGFEVVESEGVGDGLLYMTRRN